MGARGASFRDLQELITALGLQDSVELTGWISQERLLDLYQRAQAVVYPSLFEGFGMPILEALAARVPLACSDIPPLREVAGEAALYFDPLSLDAITSALNRIRSDVPLQLHLADLGSERVRHYTWRRASEATLKVIAE